MFYIKHGNRCYRNRKKGCDRKIIEQNESHEEHLRRIISRSKRLGHIHYFDIRNVSAWYQIRGLMGPKRQSTYIIKQMDRDILSYSAEIYDIFDSSKNIRGYVVKKRAIGTFSSYVEAYHSCEKACHLRDKKGFGLNSNIETHFHVIITSSKFETLNQYDRSKLFFEDLVDDFSTPIGLAASHPNKSFSSIKGVSFPESHVRSFYYLHYLNLPFEVLLDLRTPESHECGEKLSKLSSTKTNSLLPANHSLPAEIMYLKKLYETKNLSNKACKPFRHFFHGLCNESKQLVLQEYELNSKLARFDDHVLNQCQYKDLVVTKGQKQVHSIIRNKMKVTAKKKNKDSIYSNKEIKYHYGAFVNHELRLSKFKKEKYFIDKYITSRHSQIEFATRIQRIYRRKLFVCIKKKWIKEHQNAVKIQCQIRRKLAYWMSLKRRKLYMESSIIIQKIWRASEAKNVLKRKKTEILHLVIKIQPIVRGYLARSNSKWERKHWNIAINIQKYVRRFIAMSYTKKLRAGQKRRLLEMFASLVQRSYRSYVIRQRANQVVQTRLYFILVNKKALKIQSHIRRWSAKRRLLILKTNNDTATTIQKQLRGRKIRIEMKRLRLLLLKEAACILIQSHIRGTIDRTLFRILQAEKKFVKRDYPAIITIQTIVRAYINRCNYKIRRIAWNAAKKIQAVYRSFKSRTKLQRMKELVSIHKKKKSSIFIQKIVRGVLSRKLFHLRLHKLKANRFYAARKILRCWCRYNDLKRLKKIRTHWRVQHSYLKLSEYNKERGEILSDIKLVESDMNDEEERLRWVASRKKDLKFYFDEEDRRKSQLHVEVKNSGRNHDCISFGHGRDEHNFEIKKEHKRLHSQHSLAREELIILRCTITRSKKRISNLRLEYESTVFDLDEINQFVFDEFGTMRNREIEACIRKGKDEFESCVRTEISRWKVKFNLNQNPERKVYLDKNHGKTCLKDTKINPKIEGNRTYLPDKMIAETWRILRSA